MIKTPSTAGTLWVRAAGGQSCVTSEMLFCAFHTGKWHLGHHGHHHPNSRGKGCARGDSWGPCGHLDPSDASLTSQASTSTLGSPTATTWAAQTALGTTCHPARPARGMAPLPGTGTGLARGWHGGVGVCSSVPSPVAVVTSPHALCTQFPPVGCRLGAPGAMGTLSLVPLSPLPGLSGGQENSQALCLLW